MIHEQLFHHPHQQRRQRQPAPVIHFLAFITHNDRGGTGAVFSTGSLYEVALKKSRKLGGRKFHNKQYGGGIVFQAYSDDEVYELVARANATSK